jgi:hypothetical protein
MKYIIQFLNKFIGVKKFQVMNNNLYILFNNTLRIIEHNNETIIDFNSDDLFIVNDKLFSDENFYYDTKNKKKETIKLNYYYTGLHLDNNLVFTNKDLVIYSLKENAIIKNVQFFEDSSLSLLLEDKFIVRGNDFYSLHDLKSLNIIWKYSFSELLKGHEIKQYGNIVVYENRLYVYLSDDKDSKNTATISIELNTSNILNTYQGFAGNLMLSNDKLYVASYEMVKILNLTNNQIIEIDFTDILKPLALQIHWNTSVVQEDYLYFVDGHSRTTNKLGVLDLKSRTLVWHTEIEIDDDINNNIQNIKVIDDKIYVHCSDNILHIFEIHKN